MYIAEVQKLYAMVLGIVLVLLGIIGFFNAPILGLFGVNTVQNIVHLVGGAVVLWFGYQGSGNATNMWLGIVALVVGILGFIPGTNALLANWLAINTAISVLHVVVGVVSLGVSFAVPE